MSLTLDRRHVERLEAIRREKEQAYTLRTELEDALW